MNAKQFVKTPRLKPNVVLQVDDQVEEPRPRSLNKKDLMLSLINSIGNDIEDKKEAAEKLKWESLGRLKGLEEAEKILKSSCSEKANSELLHTISDFSHRVNEIRQELAESHHKNQGRKEAFGEVVDYLNSRRITLMKD